MVHKYLPPLFVATLALLFSLGPLAGEVKIPAGVSEAELESAVKARMKLVKGLLSGKVGAEIKASGNEEAIAALKDAKRGMMDLRKLLAAKKVKEAYKAVHALFGTVRDASKKARAKKRKQKMHRHAAEEAKAINESFYGVIERKGHGKSGDERALRMIRWADTHRDLAIGYWDSKDYEQSAIFYDESTLFLRQAVRILDRKPGRQQAEEAMAINDSLKVLVENRDVRNKGNEKAKKLLKWAKTHRELADGFWAAKDYEQAVIFVDEATLFLRQAVRIVERMEAKAKGASIGKGRTKTSQPDGEGNAKEKLVGAE